MNPNRSRYLASLSAELRAQATRVRDLIGDKHWLTDGHHKEYLVKHILARHVPAGVSVSRGFVVHPQRADLISREQDLLVVDTLSLAPIFDQGGVCVAFPQQVIAALAVKTTFGKDELVDACDTLFTARKIAAYAGTSVSPWCGVLFFEADKTPADKLCGKVGGAVTTYESTAEELQAMRSVPDVIAIADAAGFLVDPIDTSNKGSSVRGFAGDGVAVLLNSLLLQIARFRNANGAEFEQFATGASTLSPLPGSPFTAKT